MSSGVAALLCTASRPSILRFGISPGGSRSSRSINSSVGSGGGDAIVPKKGAIAVPQSPDLAQNRARTSSANIAYSSPVTPGECWIPVSLPPPFAAACRAIKGKKPVTCRFSSRSNTSSAWGMHTKPPPISPKMRFTPVTLAPVKTTPGDHGGDSIAHDGGRKEPGSFSSVGSAPHKDRYRLRA
jgi:hypothetical protein